MSDYRFLLGRNALTNEKLSIPFDELKRHWHVLGRTGKGKTKALEILTREIILSRSGLVVLDGKGDLYEAILAFCAAERLEDRVVIIDPTNQDWAVGLNYLELLGNTNAETLAELVTEGLKKSFEEDGLFKPLQEEWTPASLLPLIRAKMTLIELEDFVSMTRPKLRTGILKSLGQEGERLANKWSELKAYGEHEAAVRTAVVRTRGSILRNSIMSEAIFGQAKTTVDWRKVLDEGGIVLIRAHRHPQISRRLRLLIGTTVLHQLMQTAFSRPKDYRPDAWLIADEFQQFCCNDFVEGLAQLRSFKLWLILSNQELKQLEMVPGMKEAVLAECSGKIYFSLSHVDAEETVHELFQHDIHGNNIKHLTLQTKFRPVEVTRTIDSEADSEADSRSESSLSAGSSCSGTNSSFGSLPDGTPSFESMGFSAITSYGDASGRQKGWSRSRSSGQTQVPWYEYEEFLEESSRQFYSIEEVLERLKRWLMLQEPRKAQLKIGDWPTLPILTRFVDEAVVLEEELQDFLQQVLSQCALPMDKARAEIAQRQSLFLENLKQAEEKPQGQEKIINVTDLRAKVKEQIRELPSRWE